MLTREEFDRQFEWFQGEFTEKLSETRKTFLFQNIYYLEPIDLNETFVSVVERYKKDDLPTIKAISIIAYNCSIHSKDRPSWAQENFQDFQKI